MAVEDVEVRAAVGQGLIIEASGLMAKSVIVENAAQHAAGFQRRPAVYPPAGQRRRPHCWRSAGGASDGRTLLNGSSPSVDQHSTADHLCLSCSPGSWQSACLVAQLFDIARQNNSASESRRSAKVVDKAVTVTIER